MRLSRCRLCAPRCYLRSASHLGALSGRTVSHARTLAVLRRKLAGCAVSRPVGVGRRAAGAVADEHLPNGRRSRCRSGGSPGGRRGLAAGDGPIHGGAGHAEQVADLGGAVLAAVQELDQVRFLARVELGLLAPQMTLGLATRIPSRVRDRMRSASNSATIAKTLNSSRPTGSVGSHTDAPRLSRTFRLVRSSAIARASGSDRASRSSLVTTSLSPARQAARASRSPGRSRFVPVRP